MPAVEQLFRRMVFNVVARNQDDHVKNIAFLMDRGGAWSLAPAYDVTYAYRPGNRWTRAATRCRSTASATASPSQDLRDVARAAGLKRGRADAILAEVSDAVAGWRAIAEEDGVDEAMASGSPARTGSSLPS